MVRTLRSADDRLTGAREGGAMTAPTASTLDVDALRTASDSHAALVAVIADDIEWIDVPPSRERSVYRGRESVLAMLDSLEQRGIVSTVVDGLASGDRAALTVTCTFPDGSVIVTNSLIQTRDGNIARWFGVEAWEN
jgi:hypothetical protein